jgi:ribonucleoside-diphosphate reductase alpha chain
MSDYINQDTKSKVIQEPTTTSSQDELIKARKEAIKEANTEPEIKWLTENSRKFLASGYLTEGTNPEERIREIAERAEEILKIDGFADKFYGYMAEGYYSLASDDMGDILYTQSEVGMMSKLGGGTSGYFGKLRHRGAPVKNNGESSGAVHIMQLFEKMVDVVSQGSVRRGRFSPYLPIDHKDIHEFLEIGTEGNPIQELTHGVTVGNDWMMLIKEQSGQKCYKEEVRSVILTSSLKTMLIMQHQMFIKTKSMKYMPVIYVLKSCCLQTKNGLSYVYYLLSTYYITISGKIQTLLKRWCIS